MGALGGAVDTQRTPTPAIQVDPRCSEPMLWGHQQPVLIEVHRLGFDVKLPLLVWRAKRSPIFQFVAELGEGGASRRWGRGVGGGARLVSVADSSIDGDQANAFLAADVGAVGAGVGEPLLTVGALVRLLTCNTAPVMDYQIDSNKSSFIVLADFIWLCD